MTKKLRQFEKFIKKNKVIYLYYDFQSKIIIHQN
jgi:hypothetical protein